MTLAFLIMSVFVGGFMTIIWSKSGIANVLIKTAFFSYTAWGIVLLIALVTPMISASGMKLI